MSLDLPEELVEFSRARLTRQGPLVVGGKSFAPEALLDLIAPLLTDERKARLAKVVSGRTYGFVPVLESPYDLGNISAVMRSCEAFGFLEVDLIIPPGSKFKTANRVARGADKWLDVQIYRSNLECAKSLKDRGFQIFATHLSATVQIEELDFSKPTAVVLGNEKDGVTNEMLDLVDGSFVIPMSGFSQSFNISVAAALVFYHAWRDRHLKLGSSGDLTGQQLQQVLANYYLRCLDNPEIILKQR